MKQENKELHKETMQRLTVFIDPDLVKRAKVQAALEGVTLSDVVEKSLNAYTPKIEKM
jgi:predicted HicB family RNase H-like nuclease